MKTLTKIFMAVVALFAVSCVTDTTDDLGVQLGNDAGQTTTISVSLEESRTHLGEKVGEGEDGQYPLYWSEGDKIAVNGVASAALEGVVKEQTYAEFTLNGVLGFPRTIVYPAPAEGVTATTAGKYPVTFLATQAYKENSFAEGAAPMYAYQSSSEATVELQHLSGVLRLAPYGEGVTLKAVVVTAENGALAGNFDVAADGTLTAHADATGSVTVTFGEGLALGATDTEADKKPIYVAVPAGEFGMVSVTLYASNGYMTKKFNTDGEAIKAGKVREFPAFEFTASGEAGDDFLIYDEASLREFSTKASTTASAKVVANVDMTNKTWSAIDGFAGAFDGGNHEIKGLTAPLFGTTTATEIKNLKLVNVNIEETANHIFGTLACTLDNENAVVENCSATGEAIVNLASPNADAFIAGLIGSTTSTKTFSNLTNAVNIEIKGKYIKNMYGVGCVCKISTGKLSNVRNLGTIKFTGETAHTKTSSQTIGFGGIAAYCNEMTNCYNGVEGYTEKGAIIQDGSSQTTRLGGIMPTAQSLTKMTSCINYGKITVTATSTKTGGLMMGGIVGINQSLATEYVNCENKGELSVYGNITGKPRVGGLAGQASTTTLKITGSFTNSGNIIVNNKSAGDAVQISGFIANYSKELHASSSGTIKNSGNISYGGTATGKLVRVAGLFGAASLGTNLNGGATELYLVNTGDITVTGTGSTIYVGGIYSNSNYAVTNARCYCNIKAIGHTNVGMIYSGYASAKSATKTHCGGTIWTSGDKATNISLDNYAAYFYGNTTLNALELRVKECGYISAIDAEPEYAREPALEINSVEAFKEFAANAANVTADVNITASIDMSNEEWTPITGYSGTINGNNNTIKGLKGSLFGTTEASVKNLKLTDMAINITDITYADKDDVGYHIGAIACYINNPNAVIENCSVAGEMTINCAMTEAQKADYVYISGLVGKTTSQQEFKNLTSELTTEITGSYNSGYFVTTGLIGVGSSCSLTDSKHLGTISFAATGTGHLFAGGLVHECAALTRCINGDAEDTKHTKGSITHSGESKNTYLCGVTPSAKCNMQMVDCYNYGALTFTEQTETKGVSILAGMIGYFSKTDILVELDNCANYGPLTANSKSHGGDLKIGGCVGHLGNNSPLCFLNGYTNNGDINIAQQSGEVVQIGGILGNATGIWTATSTGIIRNDGDIYYNGTSSSTVRVGGLMGAGLKVMPSNIRSENCGNIKVEGTGGTVYIGGISADNRCTANNARCFCRITAIGYENVGMIIGGYAETKLATNCHIGGSLILQDPSETNGPTDIEIDNFHQYIYSKRDIDISDIEPTNCGWLEKSINDTPKSVYEDDIVIE